MNDGIGVAIDRVGKWLSDMGQSLHPKGWSLSKGD